MNVIIPGAYTPVTMEGNIIADGVLTSCYAFSDHDLAHIGMTPIRWFPDIADWIFGDDNGSQAFVNIAEVLGNWMLPYWQLDISNNFH